MAGNDRGTVRIQVTSIDGNLDHPFRRTDTIGDVRKFAYEHLVKDKSGVPFTATTIELGGVSIADSEAVGSLADAAKNRGKEIDLVVSLTWVSQGG